jgi:hypothetical protein
MSEEPETGDSLRPLILIREQEQEAIRNLRMRRGALQWES